MTASLRMLAYRTHVDSLDKYVKITKSTMVASLRAFYRGVVSILKKEYFRSPTEADTMMLLLVADQHGFPRMLGSLDCMHWQWDKCPAYHGFFLLVAVVNQLSYSKQLLCMICGSDMLGSFNYINALHQSNLFDELSAGRAPSVNYFINGTQFNIGYYLSDGIYTKWATIVQTISQPQGRKKKLFARMQEVYCKDVGGLEYSNHDLQLWED